MQPGFFEKSRFDRAYRAPRVILAGGAGQSLEGTHDLRFAFAQRGQELGKGGVEVLVRALNCVSETGCARRIGSEELGAPHHAQRRGRPDECQQIGAAAPGGRNTHLTLDEADAGMAREHAHVAGDRKFGPAADGIAVHRRDYRHREIADRIQRSGRTVVHRANCGRLPQALELVQVATCGETPITRPAYHGEQELGRPGVFAEMGAEFVEYGLGQCIALVRAVDEYVQNAILDMGFDESTGDGGSPGSLVQADSIESSRPLRSVWPAPDGRGTKRRSASRGRFVRR